LGNSEKLVVFFAAFTVSDALFTAFAASTALSATLAIFAVSAISHTNGKTPSASSPADVKSPLARSTGIAKRSAIVSTPGISDTAVKKLLKASKLAP